MKLIYQRIVVKIGSTSLTHASGRINLAQFERLAWVLSDLRAAGCEVVLVSSGAIAVGSERLRLAERPRDVTMRQAASAVGQGALMQIYEASFSRLNQTIAQVLLHRDVFEHEQMRANARNALSELLRLGVIPIINENDAVSTAELQGFSDNDQLAAAVALLLGADALVLFSDIDAVYDKNPHLHKNAHKIAQINEITPEIMALAGESASALGTGGMKSKFTAAQKLLAAGRVMVIASGENVGALQDICAGQSVGTIFCAKK